MNEGEAKNALARRAEFQCLGHEPAGRCRYLERAVEQIRGEIDVPGDYLQYLSPVGWEHINLTGDYIWNLR